MSFAGLGVRAPVVEALLQEGIEVPFPVQALALPDALAGRDLCVKAKTGSGKTIAFAVPLAHRIAANGDHVPRGLVLVPTRELAMQVFKVIRPLARAAGLRSAVMYGGASLDRQAEAARRGIDIIVATPGRLIDMLQRGAVSLAAVEMVILDEADRMADMGFFPQVEWVLRQLGDIKPQVLLFSATLDGQVDRLITRYLKEPVHHAIEEETETVEEMSHRFLAVHQMDRVRVAAAIGRSHGRSLVFVRTKRGADRLATQLTREGVKAAAIHGDLRQSARERVLRQFMAGSLPVLVATDVAARGIHVDDVDVVIQFDPPEDHKSYLHRAGRTARAGQAGTVVTLVLWDQMIEVERLQRRLGLAEPVVEVFSNDPRLTDLSQFEVADVAS